MSSFTDHIIERVDRAGQSLPADCASIDELVTWADRVGETTMLDIIDWQPTLATVIVMPKR